MAFMRARYTQGNKKERRANMAQELDQKLRTLRAELTQVVRDGLDGDGTLLRRMLAELERLENQRLELRHSARGG
jgi:hypothetical protein